MITIWDLHYDEYKRLDFFIGHTTRYKGDDCPVGPKLIVSEGSRYKVPSERIPNVILYPCVRDTADLVKQGFRYAFTKDEAQRQHFGNNSLTLPPIFPEITVNFARTIPACSMIHLLQQRDRKAAQFIRNLGIVNYGLPDNPCNDIETLGKTKFLVHPKTIGYLCNAVIKAMSTSTPVIFTEESFKYGYQDYLTPDVSCIVVKNEQQARRALMMDDQKYRRMQEQIRASVQRVRNSYDQVRRDTAAFIERVWPA